MKASKNVQQPRRHQFEEYKKVEQTTGEPNDMNTRETQWPKRPLITCEQSPGSINISIVKPATARDRQKGTWNGLGRGRYRRLGSGATTWAAVTGNEKTKKRDRKKCNRILEYACEMATVIWRSTSTNCLFMLLLQRIGMGNEWSRTNEVQTRCYRWSRPGPVIPFTDLPFCLWRLKTWFPSSGPAARNRSGFFRWCPSLRGFFCCCCCFPEGSRSNSNCQVLVVPAG